MTRLFKIREDDLMDLERILPDLQFMIRRCTPSDRARLRKAEEIISNIRWHDPKELDKTQET